VDVDSPHISSVPSDYESQPVKTTTQADRIEREEQAKAALEETKAKSKQAAEKAKSKSRHGKNYVQENSDNPVILGNTILIATLGGLLGYSTYRKYTAGELTWKVVGLGAAAVAAFGAADYFISQYVSTFVMFDDNV
jgi:hypothetical protein